LEPLARPRSRVPFVDLKRQHGPLREEIHERLDEALDTSAFILGEQVALLEAEFAAYCGARYGIGVGNGTDALTLALAALGVERGDCVLSVPNTFIATAEAISNCGATPVFVDCDAATYTMDPAEFDRHLRLRCRRNGGGELIDIRTGGRLRAVIPVHLYGYPADMDAINEVAHSARLAVVEDAAQAHGALYRGRRVGGLGDCACFSFYPGKNLGAAGDAGMVVTNDERVRERLRLLRDHGKASKYEHVIPGYNSRLDEIQAAILRLKLRHLDDWNATRRMRAAEYGRLLAPSILSLPPEEGQTTPVYHLYVVRLPGREMLMEALSAAGIGCGIHYPVPVHLSPAYSHLGYRKGELPVSEQYAEEVLSLPMFAEMRAEEVETVADAVLNHFRELQIAPPMGTSEVRL
jgi:dTDP-4-amino-4,6-dideoxygalactose transaminase